MNRRVVISGLGVVSSIGIGKDAFWDALIKGTNGISPIESFDTAEFPTHNGGEVKNFDPSVFLSPKKMSHMGRASRMAVSASILALQDANIPKDSLIKERTGVSFGTTMGESQIIETINRTWIKQGIGQVDSRLIPEYPCYTISAHVGLHMSVSGPNIIIPNACAAGNFAVGYACDLIRQGKADVMICGGADAFSRIAFIGFNQMFAVAPEKCQPFDKNRKGMMVAEGAGAVILETLESAQARKATIYAELIGWGMSSDAHHMTAPFAPGIADSLSKALADAHIQSDDVDYINAHGTGTPANDVQECAAIKQVFKERSRNIPVSSIKSMLGHTMGAASAIETVATALAVKQDIIPPTINFQTPDPECDIDCVPNAARKTPVRVALNSSSAFGGNNACLVLKKFN